MFSLADSELKVIDKFSRIESAIKGVKNDINWLEINRLSDVLKSLKDDEDRLTKCIDDIEVFHRDMFVLLNKENKPTDSENAPATKDYMSKTDYSVTEPEYSGNEPMYSVNETDFPMHEPDRSKNVQHSCRRKLILIIPRSRIYNRHSSKNESDHTYGTSFSRNESGDSKNETGDGIIESGDGKDESSDDMDEPGDGMDKPSNGMDEPGDGMDGPGNDMDEPADSMDESSDDENEMTKKVLLNLLADKEKEITESVLHLIYKFSCFQSRLQKAEARISQTIRIFPGGSNVKVRKMLEALSGYVLYLDKTVSKIYAKYSEMIENLGKKFQ